MRWSIIPMLAALLFGAGAGLNAAQENTTEMPNDDSISNEPSARNQDTNLTEDTNAAPPAIQEDNPEAEDNRTLGDAFKNFRPSEEISADNPVPFPVDI